jgi:hypothetical protein
MSFSQPPGGAEYLERMPGKLRETEPARIVSAARVLRRVRSRQMVL